MDLFQEFFEPVFWKTPWRLLVAIGCGIIVGLEREYRAKPAGVRTHMLVSMGAALFMIVSEYVAEEARLSGYTNADPGRIAAQVVTGIGFLGAGAILHSRGLVLGLTSAATIWCMAAIGITAGVGLVWTAGACSIGLVAILQLFTFVETFLRRRRFRYVSLEIILKNEARVHDVRRLLRAEGVVLSNERVEHVLGEDHYYALAYFRGEQEDELTDRLMQMKGVRDVILFDRNVSLD